MENIKESKKDFNNKKNSRLSHNNCISNKSKKEEQIEIMNELNSFTFKNDSFDISEYEQEIKDEELNDNSKHDISEKRDKILKEESNLHIIKENDDNDIKQNTKTNFNKSNNIKKKAGKGFLPQNIDIQFLSWVNGNSWQFIIKEIFNIDRKINLDDILKNINLDSPVNSYVAFLREFYKSKVNSSDKHKVDILQEKIVKEWRKMTNEQKKPFENISKQSQINYDKNMALVNKFLFLGNNFLNNKNIDAFDIYLLDEIINDNNNKTKKEIEIEAENNWKNNLNILK